MNILRRRGFTVRASLTGGRTTILDAKPPESTVISSSTTQTQTKSPVESFREDLPTSEATYHHKSLHKPVPYKDRETARNVGLPSDLSGGFSTSNSSNFSTVDSVIAHYCSNSSALRSPLSVEVLNRAVQSCVEAGNLGMLWRLLNDQLNLDKRLTIRLDGTVKALHRPLKRTGNSIGLSIDSFKAIICACAELKDARTTAEWHRSLQLFHQTPFFTLLRATEPPEKALSLFESFLRAISTESLLHRVFREEVVANNLLLDRSTFHSVMRGVTEQTNLDRQQVVGVFSYMKKIGVEPDVETYTILIDMFARSGLSDKAIGVFEHITSSGFEPTVDSYNSLIKVYAKHDFGFVKSILRQMKSTGIEPNSDTFAVIITSRNGLENIDETLRLYSAVKKMGMAMDGDVCLNLIKTLKLCHRTAEMLEILRDLATVQLDNTQLLDQACHHIFQACLDNAEVDRAVETFEWLSSDAVITNLSEKTLAPLVQLAVEQDSSKLQSIINYVQQQSGSLGLHTLCALMSGYAVTGQLSRVMQVYRQGQRRGSLNTEDNYVRAELAASLKWLGVHPQYRHLPPETGVQDVKLARAAFEEIAKAFEMMESMDLPISVHQLNCACASLADLTRLTGESHWNTAREVWCPPFLITHSFPSSLTFVVITSMSFTVFVNFATIHSFTSAPRRHNSCCQMVFDLMWSPTIT